MIDLFQTINNKVQLPEEELCPPARMDAELPDAGAAVEQWTKKFNLTDKAPQRLVEMQMQQQQ